MANKKIPGLGVHHIALKVSDFEKSKNFYVNGLGMEPIVGWGEGNGEALMLDIGDGAILELFAGGNANETTDAKYLHFAMGTDDVDGAYQIAVDAGASPLTPPKSVPLESRPYKMTLRVAFVKGFDGEELEFFKVEKKGE